jgi:dTDP-4-dehydrorhamnose reductase
LGCCLWFLVEKGKGMKLLVFGQTGQVARELIRRLPAGVTLEALGRDRADLSDPAICADAIIMSDADAVINAAAWTAVDRAETDEADATIINGAAPAAMARACARHGIPFLHISTDYVFDGAGDAPFATDHPTAPLGAYGRSKLAGELGVRSAGGAHLILRTSWVVSAHGANFVKTMRRLGADRDSLNVVVDQIGGPTPAADIADALFTAARALIDGASGGTHHFSGVPDTSWADFARAIMAGAGLKCQITDIPSSAYPTPAKRPHNSRLDCSAFMRDFGIARPDWRAGLADILSELETA